ncbi:hypothetical protein C8Q69DRAFT_522763 [Paecilomyces variotii]|uniref:Uncharacterized protein n=1 Tax=Byssochlamys spectabilis TaxID=264951 RepID=A0A443HR19_BYSSP|nr:hypothetical protein C8Q69DRAFT_522763 [Paecilomyces variotii]KAJ9363129.1 hypothetical protein DTO280E4_2878 [Paecilomyces variotii]KAJ9372395.1 hypothetical protein DTO282E5_2982 [Paecilomyces variotii]RWQ94239.1 hypothetical protein C8Q69DRAFT_522763 [Paecilomyces variotii]
MEREIEEHKSAQEGSVTAKTPDDSITIPIHSVKAKLYLNRPIEELIPSEYLKKADESPVPGIIPWVFRAGSQDGRAKDLDFWPDKDPYFMNLYKALKEAPAFERSFYEAGSEYDEEQIPEEEFYMQGSAMHEYLEELFDMLLGKDRETAKTLLCHLSHKRCISADMAYLTGYQDRHYDAPTPSGFIALQMNHRPKRSPHYIVPISITQDPEPILSAISGKLKMMLTQLYLNLKAHRNCKADQLPDQEVFLLGMHGSRLHIFRALFPGIKSSVVWCGRSSGKVLTEAGTSTAQTSTGSASTGTDLDGEPDLRTFRVVATHEYDLWDRSDFHAATRALVALFMYMLSSEAKIGPIEAMFELFPPRLNVRAEKTGEKKEEAIAEQVCEEYNEETEDEAESAEQLQHGGWWGLGDGYGDFDLFADYGDESASL